MSGRITSTEWRYYVQVAKHKTEAAFPIRSQGLHFALGWATSFSAGQAIGVRCRLAENRFSTLLSVSALLIQTIDAVPLRISGLTWLRRRENALCRTACARRLWALAREPWSPPSVLHLRAS